jgi:hypothetical protein
MARCYVADGGNRRVRRIHQVQGQWRVDTWAGGGKRRLGPGESVLPNTVAFSGTLAVAVTPAGEVTIADNRGAYRVTADGARCYPWHGGLLCLLRAPNPAS